MLQRMTYFRFKWLRLPIAYRQFIERWLMPGDTIFLVECGLRWPATLLDERYVFQFGALGGATSDRCSGETATMRPESRLMDPPAGLSPF